MQEPIDQPSSNNEWLWDDIMMLNLVRMKVRWSIIIITHQAGPRRHQPPHSQLLEPSLPAHARSPRRDQVSHETTMLVLAVAALSARPGTADTAGSDRIESDVRWCTCRAYVLLVAD